MTEEQQKAKKLRDAEKEDLKWVVSDSRGRRVMRRILEQAGIFRSSFAGEHPQTTAFNEGQRNIGLFVNNEIIEVCPEQWVQTMKGN